MGYQKTEEKRLFANFKKSQFYKNKVRFLRYIVSAQEVQMKDERIDMVKDWS